MTPAPLILAASLLCNAALLARALLKHPAPGASAPTVNRKLETVNSTTFDPHTLAQLFANDDTHALIQYLHEKNIPADIIRSIARARLDQQFAARRAALEDPPPPFWRKYSKLPQSSPNLNRRAEKLVLEDEYQAALKDLTAGLPLDRSAAVRREFGDLSDAKIAQIQAINKDYGDMRAQLRADMNGVTLSGDQAQLDLLNTEQRADLAKVLTPDELRDYDLRSSPAAAQVQNRIQYFGASEAEYTALYDAQAVVDEQTAGQNLSAYERTRLHEAAVQAVLTPERFEEYKIVSSDTYPHVNRLVNSLELPKTASAQILTTQNETTAQAHQIRNDTTLTPADRDAHLSALAQKARQQLNAVLGEEGMKQYQDNQWVSAWLRQLTPKSPQQ
jgi:hypothetical protein